MPKGEEPAPELMYRPPGSEIYRNLTDVLDDILNRLDEIDQKLQNLEKNQ